MTIPYYYLLWRETSGLRNLFKRHHVHSLQLNGRCQTFHPLIILQGEQGIEQTDDEMFALAKYLLEGQVGFRV